MIEFIKSTVSQYPNLSFQLNKAERHRIKKSGWKGSLWITPRKDGFQIYLNGDVQSELSTQIRTLCGDENGAYGRNCYWNIQDEEKIKTIIAKYSEI